jgi:hypothetical protein
MQKDVDNQFFQRNPIYIWDRHLETIFPKAQPFLKFSWPAWYCCSETTCDLPPFWWPQSRKVKRWNSSSIRHGVAFQTINQLQKCQKYDWDIDWYNLIKTSVLNIFAKRTGWQLLPLPGLESVWVTWEILPSLHIRQRPRAARSYGYPWAYEVMNYPYYWVSGVLYMIYYICIVIYNYSSWIIACVCIYIYISY